VSFGAGGAVGSLVSGYLWKGINPQAMFLLAAVASLLALLVILRGMRSEY
jgi:PPP family 3-phenylpropionic acid transporter